MAAEMRQIVEQHQGEPLVLERSPLSATGFTNVIKVKGKYQARLQVPGDGRGGSKKRKQVPLPGLFNTALDAARYLAMYKKHMKENNGDKIVEPPKLDKQHKPRTQKPAQPAAAPQQPTPLQSPMPTAVGMPLAMPMWQLPFAAVTPLPMQPIGYSPPLV